MKPAFRRQAHSRRLVRIGVVSAVLAAAAGAGSLAYATILVNPSVIHGGAGRSGGALRLASKCSKNERAVTWNNTGPAGTRGATGLQGPPGSQGAQGATGAAGAAGAAGVNRDIIGGGDGSCGTPLGAATYFVGMFGANCVSTPEAASQLAMPANGTVQELHATMSSAPGTGNSLTFTIRKNGVSTPVACTISGSATSCADSTNAVGFSTSDLLSVQITQTSGVVANIDYGWTSQFVPS
jgi:hypothetical protein